MHTIFKFHCHNDCVWLGCACPMEKGEIGLSSSETGPLSLCVVHWNMARVQATVHLRMQLVLVMLWSLSDVF